MSDKLNEAWEKIYTGKSTNEAWGSGKKSTMDGPFTDEEWTEITAAIEKSGKIAKSTLAKLKKFVQSKKK